MALTILLMSNVASEPLRLMIFMPLTPFLLAADARAGRLNRSFHVPLRALAVVAVFRAQNPRQGVTCAFGNFVKFCGPVPFGPLGRCPYNTSFRHHILCFLGFKNPWIGGVGCFPPRRKNGKIPGGHSKNRVFQTAKIGQFSTAKIAVNFRQTGAQTNDFPTCPQQGLDAATEKVARASSARQCPMAPNGCAGRGVAKPSQSASNR